MEYSILPQPLNKVGEISMLKYLLKRLLHGIVSIIIVVTIVMVMIYGLLDPIQVFAKDPMFSRTGNNTRTVYMNQKWEEYGYQDYVTYGDYLNDLVAKGELDSEAREKVGGIGRTPDKDSDAVAEYVQKFTDYYESQGYKITRLDAKMTGRKVATGGQQTLFATKAIPLSHRVWEYFTGLLDVDSIHNVKEDIPDRGLTFTLHDPLAEGRFSPAIIGSGTTHKYLLYFDSTFPYIHQNIVTIKLGTSYTVATGIDVFETMTRSQGSYVLRQVTFPTGLTEDSADDLHTATYLAGSREGNLVYADRFVDDYTNVGMVRNGLSKLGYSFVIGIIATAMAYFLGVPLGVLMARKKETFIDNLGTLYIVFIIAVPSLAYIFLFKAIGFKLGMPTIFDMDSTSKLMYVLPIVSLALPSIGSLMKWVRRYMIDQMNSDYVKFARSGGLTENEIFTKHILKNAIVPIVHGIPASILGAMTGAIITERVYVVPGAGNLLTEAINKYDNSVIVGVTLFYAVLTVVSLLLGDILMATVDPRISFTTKDR